MEPGIHIAIMPSAIPTRPSRLVPRGNHRMLVPGTKELVAGYLDLLADWAARRVAQSQRIAKPVSERQGYLSFGLALGNT
jgi:hypothetical protein